MAKHNRLICHVMHDMIYEVGTVKTKIQSQEFNWRKRMWPIEKNAVAWIDRKGIKHMFFDVNESDGTIRWLHGDKYLEKIDKCTACGDRISIDAKNTYDLLKRKTINAIWGIDSSHIVLLIIMGIVAIGAMAGIMYLIGQNTKLQEQLNKYLPAPTNPNAKLMLGAMVIHGSS